ncbi:hypothetical protein [Falsarthrobacter nasiphocae]|uniref:Signal recognition particle receptor subunit beta n=1 Tax=Falsarthrobacter nasiphocae TaxID=189863 RepID=A0AAE3YHM5_9MICC|nr:hypothetical protein [Falsarthrobacter nasiphocae]MDR6892385.1 signal recognition particle receptor subunit beta [Falsarthrobacter nasiphocae]
MTHSPVSVGSTTSYRVVFVGPVGVGKTTAVRSLSEIPVVSTEVLQSAVAMTGQMVNGKYTTTVGIDYGEWATEHGRIGLFGTPGQVRFASARSSVLAARSRIILWIFGDREDAAEQVTAWMRLLGDETIIRQTTVAVTRLEPSRAEEALADLRAQLPEHLTGMPILAADPRNPGDVAAAALTALSLSTKDPS